MHTLKFILNNPVMNNYIKSFDSINESILQHGIILIKGKPRGKNGEQVLYATHVNTWAEFRPGATMLFLSDIFYRITKDGDKLRGVKINWKNEDSLKASLNLKSPGKISIVRNNNKTPYHWKTLKHTTLHSALNAVEQDLLGSEYILESTDKSTSLSEIVLSDTLNAIFKDGKNVVVLDWDIPEDSLLGSLTDDDSRGSDSTEWEASFECIYVGRPELDDQLNEADLRRFNIIILFDSSFSFNRWYDPGDFYNPPEGDTEIDDITTDISSIDINGTEYKNTFGLDPIVSEMDDHDLESFISKRHVKFI